MKSIEELEFLINELKAHDVLEQVMLEQGVAGINAKLQHPEYLVYAEAVRAEKDFRCQYSQHNLQRQNSLRKIRSTKKRNTFADKVAQTIENA